MVDTYLSATDEQTIKIFCSSFRNVMGPRRGIAAIAPDPETDHPGLEGAGDPALWYACVRTPCSITPTEGINVITPEEGIPVIGVWQE